MAVLSGENLLLRRRQEVGRRRGAWESTAALYAGPMGSSSRHVLRAREGSVHAAGRAPRGTAVYREPPPPPSAQAASATNSTAAAPGSSRLQEQRAMRHARRPPA